MQRRYKVEYEAQGQWFGANSCNELANAQRKCRVWTGELKMPTHIIDRTTNKVVYYTFWSE